MAKKKTELLKRYEEALKLLRRSNRAMRRSAYEPGETHEEVCEDIDEFLNVEVLEAEVFGIMVPSVRRGTGRVIPDLTGREHVCKYQREVKAI